MSDMPMLKVTSSPHIRSSRSTRSIMLDVIIALMPALAAAVYIFGPRVLLVTAITTASCVAAEYLTRKVLKRNTTIDDLSAVVTGLLLGFNLPVSIPWWMAVIGGVFAIIIVKQLFGGIGQNFMNPALAARVFLMVSYPSQMTAWTQPLKGLDAISTATPLAIQKALEGSASLPPLLDMFLGLRSGCLGETCVLALLIGAAWLLYRRVITLHIPLAFILTVAAGALLKTGTLTGTAYQIMSGGLILGAFYMATDYATSPLTRRGGLIFGIGCGIITCLIRFFANLPEGVSYSILLMNILVPHIEMLSMPKPFGRCGR